MTTRLANKHENTNKKLFYIMASLAFIAKLFFKNLFTTARGQGRRCDVFNA